MCYAGARLYVQADIYDQVLERLVAFTKTLNIGASDDSNTQLGPVVNARQSPNYSRLFG